MCSIISSIAHHPVTKMTLFVERAFGVLLLFGIVYGLKVVPERISIWYVDKEEIANIKGYVNRHGRKSGYYFNVEGTVLKPWYNNVTIDLIFYEYLHNEYRRSFVEMHFKVCDFLEKDVYVGGMYKKLGVTCPVFGEYHLLNLTLPTENFPYVVPFEKTRVDIYVNRTAPDIAIGHAQVYAHFRKK